MPLASNPYGFVHEYLQDAWQRSILFLDILRERGNNYFEHNAQIAPNVLHFKAELVRDGRTLPRPVNYALVRIRPTEDLKTDPTKPPFIVVDPRAGHGPGIGGMKKDSEIGMAMNAGHPCYYIGFLPDPEPGQTIEDVCRAEAAFIKEVASLHPEAEGKPVVIANCQAGWQIMMTAALNPDLAGPIMLAGSPLSYWAGVRGKNPMRYLGGMLGGSWLTALAGDLGGGIFDGAYLVSNFESLDPANTHWTKPYNVYSKVDTEGARFLDFETWWGSPVLLNAEEMQWIADNLFIGNKLSTGSLRTSDGVRIDLRNITSPIIVFCSWGDNITPPQQALGWITDIYDHEREIAENGQTIVYTLHQSIGHLGIFVSGKVGTKEHREFVNCMDLIDMVPPGLYEAVITDVDQDTANPQLTDGHYLFTLQPRTLDDIRALGANSPEDDQRFAAVARLSEVNLALYQTFAGAAVRMMTTEPMSEAMRRLHPNRVRFAIFSDNNPLMRSIPQLAQSVREARAPVSPDNPLLALEQTMSSWISASWEAWGAARDAMVETMFLGAYGSPRLQASLGLGLEGPAGGRRIERDLVREADEHRLRSQLETRFEEGGPLEAALRALIYVRRGDGSVDERGFNLVKQLRAEQPAKARRTMGELKDALREQAQLIRIDEEHAIRAIPKLLPRNEGERRIELETLHKVLGSGGGLKDEGRRRLERVDKLYGAAPGLPSSVEHGNA
jgi:hypothetical protein